MAKHNIQGARAETAVAEFLSSKGFNIVDANWKTKWCEIDIIAKKDDCIFFVEVKYRTSSEQGSGFDYITRGKLSKMRLAANSWVSINDWAGEYVLSAAEVSGDDYRVSFIEQI